MEEGEQLMNIFKISFTGRGKIQFRNMQNKQEGLIEGEKGQNN